MDFNWELFFLAFGLACVIEGVPYFLFAERMPMILRLLSERPSSSLRILGFTVILFGLILIVLGRSL